MADPELITMQEMANWLDMDVESLYARRTRRAESLPPVVTIGRRKYFRRSTVMAWLDDLEDTQHAAV